MDRGVAMKCNECGVNLMAMHYVGGGVEAVECSIDGDMAYTVNYAGAAISCGRASSATSPSWRYRQHRCCRRPRAATPAIASLRLSIDRQRAAIDAMSGQVRPGDCCPMCMFGRRYIDACDRLERCEA